MVAASRRTSRFLSCICASVKQIRTGGHVAEPRQWLKAVVFGSQP
jgi:hypothetical protein